ncbi:delta-6-fatty acid desaturase [Basidiobolus meristosporus CBS 931.73]|uniref:Delta-6-fatty acid desaturase n=1 Tax=Basidiobolus meristosporus CBS 931.73 TaxID=1314790 RepID=A0A1Y1ZDN3_9FUNG|nr:delta-6-fatty acid desaturase [Basidiobolus meristosporus CBS 931.73]|eukprot:ORY08393.1 delta-6-fatty acid desaturase [Basidiobolus meristosporus CBS 931.73]
MSEVRTRVQNGEILIIYKAQVYKLNKWIKYHPGGELAVRHMLGKDATDVVQAMHPEWVLTKKMKHFYVGDLVEEPLMSAGRTVDLKAQQRISESYKRLDTKIRSLGLYETNYRCYAWEAIRCTIAFAIMVGLILWGPKTYWNYLIAALANAFVWHQSAFCAHDAGHNEITQNMKYDSVIGILLGNYLGGLSIGWWKKSHNVHHIITNHPEHDPDIQLLPFFAVTSQFFNNLFSTYHNKILEFDGASKVLISVQHYLYYPILCFGRFNLYVQGLIFLITDEHAPLRKWELLGLAFFCSWYSYLVSFLPSWGMIFMYIMVSHVFTMMLHVQITLSHYGMSTDDHGPDESFASRQLRTTMDVDCPAWFDWFHGGLQFQTIHHLFPRVPRHNLRRVQPLVQEFCDEVDLEYHHHGFIKGNGIVIGSLRDVANQVSFIMKVAAHEARGHLHVE